MKSILGNELLKTSFKWRSYISFLTIAIIIPLIDIGLLFEEGGWARSMTRGLSSDFLVVGNIKNGYFITYFIMNALWIHVPFLITLGAGDQLAGEATGGTFRLLLTRPVSRSYILFAKYITTLRLRAARLWCSWVRCRWDSAAHCSAPVICWCPDAS